MKIISCILFLFNMPGWRLHAQTNSELITCLESGDQSCLTRTLFRIIEEAGVSIAPELNLQTRPYPFICASYESANIRICFNEITPKGRGRDFFSSLSTKLSNNKWNWEQSLNDPLAADKYAGGFCLLSLIHATLHHLLDRYAPDDTTQIEWKVSLGCAALLHDLREEKGFRDFSDSLNLRMQELISFFPNNAGKRFDEIISKPDFQIHQNMMSQSELRLLILTLQYPYQIESPHFKDWAAEHLLAASNQENSKIPSCTIPFTLQTVQALPNNSCETRNKNRPSGIYGTGSRLSLCGITAEGKSWNLQVENGDLAPWQGERRLRFQFENTTLQLLPVPPQLRDEAGVGLKAAEIQNEHACWVIYSGLMGAWPKGGGPLTTGYKWYFCRYEKLQGSWWLKDIRDLSSWISSGQDLQSRNSDDVSLLKDTRGQYWKMQLIPEAGSELYQVQWEDFNPLEPGKGGRQKYRCTIPFQKGMRIQEWASDGAGRLFALDAGRKNLILLDAEGAHSFSDGFRGMPGENGKPFRCNAPFGLCWSGTELQFFDTEKEENEMGCLSWKTVQRILRL